jgi:hypothetical protein
MSDGMEEEACACDLDGDPAELWEEMTVRARKPHRCCECGSVIPIGARYLYVKGLADDEWFRYRTCLPCWGIRRDYGKYSPLGCLAEDIWKLLGVDIVTGKNKEDDDE